MRASRRRWVLSSDRGWSVAIHYGMLGARVTEGDSMSDRVELVSEHLYLTTHVLLGLLHLRDEVDGFAENFPLASFHATVCW